MAGTNLPGGGSTGYTITGVTTLFWGTDGLLKSPSPGGTFAGTGYYIVESVDPSTEAEQVYVENGTGIKSARITLTQGAKATIVVQDDTNMTTPPQVNSTVVIVDAGCLIPGNNNRSNAYSMTVLQAGERYVRKGVAVRNLEVENLTLVDSQTPA